MTPTALLLALFLMPGDRPERVELRRYGWNTGWTSSVAETPDLDAAERSLILGFASGYDAAVVTVVRGGVRGRVYVPLYPPYKPPELAFGSPRDGWEGFQPSVDQGGLPE